MGTGRLFIRVGVAAVLATGATLGAAGVGNASQLHQQLPTAQDGYSQVSFYQTINQAPQKRQFFFANEFYYQDSSPPTTSNGAYFGFQPTDPAPDGSREMAVAFSSFRSDATVANPTLCHKGADAGAGVTCGSVIPFTLGHRYELSVTKSGKRFSGTVTDTVTGNHYEAGAYDISSPTVTGVSAAIEAFSENYHDHVKNHCNSTDFPYYEVIYGKPTAAQGAVTGTTGPISIFGGEADCPDAAFGTVTDAGSVLKIGYK
jgi:hypothetical protein